MASYPMNDKGFLLADGLVCVVIVALICDVCFNAYFLLDKYESGYQKYSDEVKQKGLRIASRLSDCHCVAEDE